MEEIIIFEKLSPYLRNFRKKDKNFNFSCPFCKEGKSPWKKRAYLLLSKNNEYFFYCHNCGLSLNLINFLKEVDKILNTNFYKEYSNKKNLERIELFKKYKKENNSDIIKNLNEFKKFYFKEFNKNNFIPVIRNIKAYKYLRRRKIPIEIIKKLFFCYRNKELPFYNMIIFPFYDNEGNIYGFQGRSIEEKRFYTFLKNDNLKIYNIFNINYRKNIYVFESIIDSLFVENSIALLGCNNNILEKLDFINKDNIVYVFDNDKSGILEAYKKAKLGYKVLVYPKDFNFKDLNEYVIKNEFNKNDIMKFINQNTFRGLKALTKLVFKIKSIK